MYQICTFTICLVSNALYLHTLVTEIGHLGIIANVRDGGNQQDIKDVENIAKRYISRPNCLVLLVISCESKLLKNVFLKFSF